MTKTPQFPNWLALTYIERQSPWYAGYLQDYIWNRPELTWGARMHLLLGAVDVCRNHPDISDKFTDELLWLADIARRHFQDMEEENV